MSSIDKQNGVRCYVVYGMYEGMNMGAFHQYLVDSVDILSYWNHLPLLYIVKTKLALQPLTDKLLPFFDKRLFIVLDVDSENVNGWLPKQAWDWFKVPAPPYKAQQGFLANLQSKPPNIWE